MKPKLLKRELTETDVVDIFVEVHRVKKITQQQLTDILNLEPNYAQSIAQGTTNFLNKICTMIRMYQLKELCEDSHYVRKHPETANKVQQYFCKDSDDCDQSEKDIVDLSCAFTAIGMFCISTEKFIRETQCNSEAYRILWGDTEDTYDGDTDKQANRYAYRFFKKLLGKYSRMLPNGVSAEDIQSYISMYIYDENLGSGSSL